MNLIIYTYMIISLLLRFYRYTFHYFIFTLTISCLAIPCFSQKNVDAGKIKEKAELFLKQSDLKQASELFQKAAQTEISSKENDTLFIAKCLDEAAIAYDSLGDYKTSWKVFTEALKWEKFVTDYDELLKCWNSLTLMISHVREKDVALNIKIKDPVKEDILFDITDIISHANDSMIVKVNAGSNQGVYAGSSGYVFGIYNKDYPVRSDQALGKSIVISVTPNTCICSIKLYNTSDTIKWVRKGDDMQLQAMVYKNTENSIIREMAAVDLNVLSNTYKKIFDPFFIMQSETNYDDELLNLMTLDVKDVAKWLDENYKDDYKNTMATGKFKNLSMLEAMKISTSTDMASFLNFVKKYPGKYIGIKYKISEIFATWLINGMYLGDIDYYFYDQILSKPLSLLPEFIKTNSFYFNPQTTDWTKPFIKLLEVNKYDSAHKVIDRLILAAEDYKHDSTISSYITLKAYNYINQKNYNDAVNLYTKALQYDSLSFSSYYYRGYSYGKLEEYDKAVKDFKQINHMYPDYAMGYGEQGWYLLLEGKMFDAQSVCKKAYLLDSTSYMFAVNYGHTFLLLGDTASAFRMYRRTLDNITSDSVYQQGPMGDMKIFETKEWQPALVKTAKEYFDHLYQTKYKYHYLSNDCSDKASKYKDVGDYSKSLDLYLKSLTIEAQSNEPRLLYTHNINSWVGYCYQYLKQYDQAEKYYKICLDMAINKLKSDKSIANDYDLLGWLYESNNNTFKAQAYRDESKNLKKKISDEFRAGTLYVVTIGINQYKNSSFDYAEQDAAKLSEQINKNYQLLYDSIVVVKLLGKEATRKAIEDKFKSVLANAKPYDAFVFYFAGKGFVRNNKGLLCLYGNNETDTSNISAQLVNTWLSMIQCERQFVIIDAEAKEFISDFMYYKGADINSESEKNQFIIARLGPRFENEIYKSSSFTKAIVEALNGNADKLGNNDGLVSAKEIDAYVNGNSGNAEYLKNISLFNGRDFSLAAIEGKTEEKKTINVENQTRGFGINGASDEAPKSNNVVSGKNYALLFGCDEYEDWRHLNNPVKDVSDLAEELKNNYGFEVEVVKNETKAEIYSKLRAYQRKSYGENDQLFIYFAGHGIYDNVSGEGYIVAKDSKKADSLKLSYLPYSDLREQINNIKQCKHIFLLLDVCFGGSFVQMPAKSTRGDDIYSAASKEEVIKRALQSRSRKYITSGSMEYVADGTPRKNSPFTTLILNKLRLTSTKFGYVLFDGLVEAVETLKGTTPRSGEFGDNEPGGNFVFDVKNTGDEGKLKSKNLK